MPRFQSRCDVAVPEVGVHGRSCCELLLLNFYFLEFITYIRPAYEAPSCYVLSHSILDTEYAAVKIADMEYLKSCSLLTYQTDGWDDKLHRSLYGHLAARMGDYPVLLGLDD